jgi:hypothetical protein
MNHQNNFLKSEMLMIKQEFMKKINIKNLLDFLGITPITCNYGKIL